MNAVTKLTVAELQAACRDQSRHVTFDQFGQVRLGGSNGIEGEAVTIEELAGAIGWMPGKVAPYWAPGTAWNAGEVLEVAKDGRLVPLTIEPKAPSALDTQVGGDHYKTAKIQPVQYIEANKLGFLEGCVVKRITRHDKPSGKGRQDIEKIIHECQLLLELRYGPKAEGSNDNG